MTDPLDHLRREQERLERQTTDAGKRLGSVTAFNDIFIEPLGDVTDFVLGDIPLLGKIVMGPLEAAMEAELERLGAKFARLDAKLGRNAAYIRFLQLSRQSLARQEDRDERDALLVRFIDSVTRDSVEHMMNDAANRNPHEIYDHVRADDGTRPA